MEEYKPIDSEQTNALIVRSKNGDTSATEELMNGNFPLIKAIVKNFLGKGVEYDDLYQIGCVGFLKAIKNFDTKFDVKFTTYAVPMIMGEIKRFLRDDGSIKVSRSIKTLANKIRVYIEKQKSEGFDSPTIEQIAEEFQVASEDVVIALDSCRQPISFQAKVDEDDPNSQNIIDKLVVVDKTQDMLDKLILKEEIMKLPEKEKKIILLRYFRGKTQGEIAEMLGISQVQVSRIESKIIEQLKIKFKEQ